MRYIKLFENYSKNDIDSICKKYDIWNYTINDDGSIDVDGDVHLSNKMLAKLPLKFNKVSGNFTVTFNFLKTLEGCPRYVGRNFNCAENQLTSLIGSPDYVGVTYMASFNKITNLNGISSIGGDRIYVSNCLLTSLEGCNESVSAISCSNNQLTSLEGCPSSLKRIECSYNKISSLKGCPSMMESLICNHNELTTLDYAPKFSRVFDVEYNYLTTLKGLPEAEKYILKSNKLPDEVVINYPYIDDIIKLQDEFMIWNSNGSLNRHNFEEMMRVIKD